MLNGVRVIEIEGIGPAPFAGMLLADLGADVIVVHRPVADDNTANAAKPILDRGKRSIVLDLKDAKDVALFKRLTDSADALIEGFRPGVMEKLGLGPETCLASNERLVYGRMTGWGQAGPLSAKAGHDLNYAGMSGAAWYSSAEGQLPFPPSTLVGDIGGGALYLVVGVLSGILNAKNTGKGTVVDAAIIDGSAHMMNLLMSLLQNTGREAEFGNALLKGAHFSRCYRTSDDAHVSVQCLEPNFYAVFLEKLGLSDRSEFQKQYDQSTWPTLSSQLEAVFVKKTQDEWMDIFANSDACVAPVLSPTDAHKHPANRQRGSWFERDGVLQAAAAPRFSIGCKPEPVNSPLRDEHREEIIKELTES